MPEDGGKSTVGRAMGVIRVRRRWPDRLGDDSTVVLEVGKALEAGTTVPRRDSVVYVWCATCLTAAAWTSSVLWRRCIEALGAEGKVCR